jgi:hypothetical protein
MTNEDTLKNIIFKLVRNIELTNEENSIIEEIVNRKLE